jgi:sulfotransferase family protein
LSVPAFIVGTGRCGSTMLSSMLREHPHVLSLSEFFSSISDFSPPRLHEIFSSDVMDGRRFWEIVAAITPTLSLALRHRIEIPEFIYPSDAPDVRFSRETGVPGILHVALPHLTDEHDHLFETLENEVSSWPEATIGEHYEHLFGWLARHFHKRLWVERSGGFLSFANYFLAMFPDARVIHVVRDGRDTALSMQGHRGFRLTYAMMSLEQFLGVHPLLSADRSQVDRVPAELRPFLPERFDADAFRAFRIPLQLFGELWSQWIGDGLSLLRTIPADRLLTLQYEDFFVDAKQQLDTLAAFLGDEFVVEAWSTRCAATVRKPRSSWRDLPEEEARALTEACRPGFEQLEAVGVHYDV